ncbi:hypothetical protein [Tuwongella immobilis]|uniref:Uncharacterized protein n=1 Tax=Tuwongella immobilis TaxID=692036 RepID=A0A6C2YJN7_9BACT|nr:hypothetical protein [Tuwongella immobilis]VIP01323.1 unnamed protein product [Tuwongella immobilis]VTR98072.1 unnamed protein product [Tuwongella immobilis]
MTVREQNLQWLGDLLEHLRECQQRLTWMENPEARAMLTEAMQRDLASCQRICDALNAAPRTRVLAKVA